MLQISFIIYSLNFIYFYQIFSPLPELDKDYYLFCFVLFKCVANGFMYQFNSFNFHFYIYLYSL